MEASSRAYLSPLHPAPGARLDEIVAALSCVVYEAEAGRDGRWLFVSDGIGELLGFTPAEWTGDETLWRRSVVAADLTGAQSRDGDVGVSGVAGRTSVTEYRMTRRDGSVVWVRDEARLARGAGSMVWRGTLTDVTRERRGRQILAGAVERYRALVAVLPTSITDPGEGAGLPDAFRLRCEDCGATWAADSVSACGACGSSRVEATSLNATLDELDRADQRVEGLLEGIEEHLDVIAQGRRGQGRFTPRA